MLYYNGYALSLSYYIVGQARQHTICFSAQSCVYQGTLVPSTIDK